MGPWLGFGPGTRLGGAGLGGRFRLQRFAGRKPGVEGEETRACRALSHGLRLFHSLLVLHAGLAAGPGLQAGAVCDGAGVGGGEARRRAGSPGCAGYSPQRPSRAGRQGAEGRCSVLGTGVTCGEATRPSMPRRAREPPRLPQRRDARARASSPSGRCRAEADGPGTVLGSPCPGAGTSPSPFPPAPSGFWFHFTSLWKANLFSTKQFRLPLNRPGSPPPWLKFSANALLPWGRWRVDPRRGCVPFIAGAGLQGTEGQPWHGLESSAASLHVDCLAAGRRAGWTWRRPEWPFRAVASLRPPRPGRGRE